MARYVAYGFRTMDDMEEDGVYLGASDDRDRAIEIGSEGSYGMFFGVFDTKNYEWLPV